MVSVTHSTEVYTTYDSTYGMFFEVSSHGRCPRLFLHLLRLSSYGMGQHTIRRRVFHSPQVYIQYVTCVSSSRSLRVILVCLCDRLFGPSRPFSAGFLLGQRYCRTTASRDSHVTFHTCMSIGSLLLARPCWTSSSLGRCLFARHIMHFIVLWRLLRRSSFSSI